MYSWRYISTAGDIYVQLEIYKYSRRYISTTDVLNISSCTYISLLYLYISGCIYISPAVLIYLQLYLYISGCIYITSVLHNFDTNGAQNFDINGAPYIISSCFYM